MMPAETITKERTYWPRWAEFLRSHGLGELTIWMLEAGGPLALIGAQMMHLGGPLFRPGLSGEAAEGLIEILEDEDERSSFIAYLREAGKT